jgi:hypothetical protein
MSLNELDGEYRRLRKILVATCQGLVNDVVKIINEAFPGRVPGIATSVPARFKEYKKRDPVFNAEWHAADINALIDEFNDAVDTIHRLERLVLQVGGIPAEFFNGDNILDESVAKAYAVDPYGKKR